MRAYSYLRFSTPEQAAGDSFRRQHEAAVAYCLQHRLELDADLSFHDLGVSAFRGDNAETGRLGDFVRAVQDGLVPRGSWLLVESLDRISRAVPRKAVRVLEDIVDLGITVVTLTDQRVYNRSTLDNDPLAFLAAFLIAIRANEESALKQRRIRAAWSAKRETAGDKPMTAISPAWLHLGAKGFEVIEARAALVRRVFELALSGVGASSIAGRFNEEGIDTFGRATMWHASYIKKILSNRSVLGEFTPHTLERDNENRKRRIPQQSVRDYFPAIVSEAVFADVNAQRAGRATGSRARNAVVSMMAGLARCSDCGATMTRVMKGTKKKGGRPKLVCTRARAKSGCRNYRTVDLERVENVIIAKREIIAAACPSGNDEADTLLNAAAERVEGLQHVVSLLIDEIIAGRASAALRDRLATCEAELDSARAELKDAAVVAALHDRIDIGRRVEEAEAVLSAAPVDKGMANAALRRLFTGAEIDAVTVALRWRHAPEAPPVELMHTFPSE